MFLSSILKWNDLTAFGHLPKKTASFKLKSMKTTRPSFLLTLFSQLDLAPVQSLFHGDVCWYTCTESGGCKVEYRGPQRWHVTIWWQQMPLKYCRIGSTKGACSPSSVGGSCSATPKECKDCTSVTKCNNSAEEPELEETSQDREVTRETSTSGTKVSLVKRVADGITCVTTCDNWPYKNCKVRSNYQ